MDQAASMWAGVSGRLCGVSRIIASDRPYLISIGEALVAERLVASRPAGTQGRLCGHGLSTEVAARSETSTSLCPSPASDTIYPPDPSSPVVMMCREGGIRQGRLRKGERIRVVGPDALSPPLSRHRQLGPIHRRASASPVDPRSRRSSGAGRPVHFIIPKECPIIISNSWKGNRAGSSGGLSGAGLAGLAAGNSFRLRRVGVVRVLSPKDF